MIGQTILHYKILEKLGEGGMGVVYKAEDTKLKRDVAIKFLPHHISVNEEERKRFEIEAQAAAALNHPNIATIYAIEESGEEAFIVMEFIDGKELKNIVETHRDASLPVNDVINYAIQIADGLEAAHKKGIVNRDIKSQNIMITSDGNVKIMDFGLAKVGKGIQLTKIGEAIGTAAYMSPEQARGDESDHRTDIWSFGVVLYEMLTGSMPFKGDYEQGVIYSILNEEPMTVQNINSDCPAFLSNITAMCMMKNKEERYNSFFEIRNELLTFKAHEIKIPAKTSGIKTEFTTNIILQKSDLCIGREKQLALLINTIEKTKQGEGKTVFISGEPGIGKTQLISHLIKNHTDSAFNIFYGRCLFNNEGGLPYHPFVNAIKNSVSTDELQFINVISGLASSFGINISHRLPQIKNFLNLSSEHSNTLLHKEQLWDAIFILFKTLAAAKPIMLILDDIQWADKASIGLFSFFARNISGIPLVLIGVHRPPETVLDFDTSALVELVRQLNIEDLSLNISLERLSAEETNEVIQSILNDQQVDAKLSSNIFHQSGGNPLFIYELVNLMKDKNHIEFTNDSWKLKKVNKSEVVSSKVQDVIKQRIDHLDLQSKELLQVASCEGEYFQSDVLSGVLNISRLVLLKQLQALENQTRIIRHENKIYRFDHILIREVLYDSIIIELREEYHRLIAQWLIDNFSGKAEYACRISHHLISAGQEEQALDYLLKAANHSRNLYAIEEALNYYNKFISLSEKNGIKNDAYQINLEEGLGDVYISLGKSEEAFKHYQHYLNIAQSQHNDLQIIKSLRKFAECNRVKGNIDEAEKLCSSALELAEKIDNKNEIIETLNTLALINASKGDYNETIDISDKALKLSEELNDQKNKSICLANSGFAYWHLGNYPVAMEQFNYALSIQRSIGDLRGLSTTLNFLGLDYWKLGKYEDAIKCSEESIGIKNKIADYRKIPGSINVIGDVYRDIGDIEKAISYHTQSLNLATEHQNKGAMCDNMRDLGEDYFLKGDYDNALKFFNDVLQLAASSNIKWYETRTYISLSEFYLERNNIEEAKKNIKPGMDNSYEIGASDLIIEALWNQAKIKAKENLPLESNKFFNDAIDKVRLLGHKTFLWKILYDYSRFLLEHGNKEESSSTFNEAKEIIMTIYNDINDETLKIVYINTKKVRELIS